MQPLSEFEGAAEVTGAAGEASVRDDVDSLKGDLMRIKDDLGVIAESLKVRVRERARSTKETAQDRYQDSVDSLEHYIEEKPLTTVLMAFGVGLLLGKIFSLK
jgi:ElaB/YqjD/DUF883 family membrane-anchored ribosome-binding protein